MMAINEKEALERRCIGPANCGIPQSESDHTRYCNGSRCMAWRELTADNITDPLNAATETVVIGGYCGLAGKP